VAELNLDDHLCFALYAASRAVAAAYRPLLTEFGLTYPQYLALVVLRESGEVSVSRLGERLRLDSGTLSPLLKRMESHGLVVRTRSENDERSVTVALTEAGRQLEIKVRCVPERLAGLAGTSGMPEADLLRLRDDANRLTALLRPAERVSSH
jgi:DNA-binding MarR family transcriptional regulator